jgi:hypothetical protein
MTPEVGPGEIEAQMKRARMPDRWRGQVLNKLRLAGEPTASAGVTSAASHANHHPWVAIMEITIPSRKHGPRVLRLVGAVPHQLIGGEMIRLSVFRAECVKCRTRFYITTTAPVCNEMNPVCFGTVHCIGHRRRTTDNAIRRHAELAERFDTEDERARRHLVWDGSLSHTSWPAHDDFSPGWEGWVVQQARAGKPG